MLSTFAVLCTCLLLCGAGAYAQVGGATYADSADFTLNTTGLSSIVGGAAYADSSDFTLNTTGLSPVIGGATYADSADFTLNTTGLLPIVGGATYADSADFTLNTGGGPPAITAQPQNQSVNPGQNANFSVTATGATPLSYQWQFNQANLAYGANSALTVTNVQAPNLGYYRVMITNGLGAVTSAEAALSLNPTNVVFADDFESGGLSNWWVYATPPMDVSSLADIVPSGGTYAAIFTNDASRMHRNILADNGGSQLSGHSRVTFWLFQVNTTTRSYCEVRGYSGATGGYSGGYNTNNGMATPDGSLAQLLAAGIFNTVTLPGETFNASRFQRRIQLNTNAMIYWFNLDGPGSPPRSVGWHQFQIERMADGATVRYSVDGVVCRTFTNAAVQGWDTLVMGSGLSTSVNGLVDGWLFERLNDPPVITGQPASTTNNIGTVATFQVVATGPNLSYQWRKNGVNLADGGNVSGAATATLMLSNVQMNDAGSYTVVVISNGAPLLSAAAAFTVVIPPALDIGLRVYDGFTTNHIAVEPGTPTSPVRINKGGTTYGVLLVDPGARNASRIRIQTSSGVKAWQKLP